jgi:hypothetical protein
MVIGIASVGRSRFRRRTFLSNAEVFSSITRLVGRRRTSEPAVVVSLNDYCPTLRQCLHPWLTGPADYKRVAGERWLVVEYPARSSPLPTASAPPDFVRHAPRQLLSELLPRCNGSRRRLRFRDCVALLGSCRRYTAIAPLFLFLGEVLLP